MEELSVLREIVERYGTRTGFVIVLLLIYAFIHLMRRSSITGSVTIRHRV